MLVALSSGHVDLADWLFLIAFIVFVVHIVLTYVGTNIPRLALVSLGLALISMAWFVL